MRALIQMVMIADLWLVVCFLLSSA